MHKKAIVVLKNQTHLLSKKKTANLTRTINKMFNVNNKTKQKCASIARWKQTDVINLVIGCTGVVFEIVVWRERPLRERFFVSTVRSTCHSIWLHFSVGISHMVQKVFRKMEQLNQPDWFENKRETRVSCFCSFQEDANDFFKYFWEIISASWKKSEAHSVRIMLILLLKKMGVFFRLNIDERFKQYEIRIYRLLRNAHAEEWNKAHSTKNFMLEQKWRFQYRKKLNTEVLRMLWTFEFE